MTQSISSLGPNETLIGQPDSRRRLMTPALVLDLDILEKNIATMAAWSKSRPEALRPHAKTHKSADIAGMQIKAGAVGVCCAKLGEAAALAANGIQNILVTSPVIVREKTQILADINGRIAELIVAVDCELGVRLLAESAAESGKPICVVVDLGVGHNRTGAATVEDAVALAQLIGTLPSLRFLGLQCYAGHVQHIESHAERAAEGRRVTDRIMTARMALEEAMGPLQIVTGGGTGSYDIDTHAGVFTDLQVGSYVFMDVEYNAVKWQDGTSGPFQPSLFVQTTVINANVDRRVTTDAGYKSFAMDGPLPVIASGAPDGSVYKFLGDEHGNIVFPETVTGRPLKPGSIITCITPHCDPTVNLYDVYHCVRGDKLVDIWPIHGRGKSW